MSRGKNCLPIVPRQFLTRNYPRPNRLLKCLPNCLSPTGEGIFSSFKTTPAVRVIARQLRDKNCPGAIFAPGHQDVSQGPLGWTVEIFLEIAELLGQGSRGNFLVTFLGLRGYGSCIFWGSEFSSFGALAAEF